MIKWVVLVHIIYIYKQLYVYMYEYAYAHITIIRIYQIDKSMDTYSAGPRQDSFCRCPGSTSCATHERSCRTPHLDECRWTDRRTDGYEIMQADRHTSISTFGDQYVSQKT